MRRKSDHSLSLLVLLITFFANVPARGEAPPTVTPNARARGADGPTETQSPPDVAGDSHDEAAVPDRAEGSDAVIVHANVGIGSPMVANLLTGLTVGGGYALQGVLLSLEGTYAVTLLPRDTENRWVIGVSASYRALPERKFHPEGGLGIGVVHFGRVLLNDTQPTWSTHGGVMIKAGMSYSAAPQLDLFLHAETLIGLPGAVGAVSSYYVSQLVVKLGVRGWLG